MAGETLLEMLIYRPLDQIIARARPIDTQVAWWYSLVPPRLLPPNTGLITSRPRRRLFDSYRPFRRSSPVGMRDYGSGADIRLGFSPR